MVLRAINLLNYDNLLDYLRKKDYKEVREGEFIVYEDKELEIDHVLVVRKGQNYKDDINKLRKEIEESTSSMEGERKEYGILFVENYIIFLRRVTDGLKTRINILRKSLDKISPAFEKKFRKLLKDIGNRQHWDELFDRSDIIEEFYKLYIKARENLLNNIKGLTNDIEKEEFADTLLMQLLIIWYLQEKGFLNNDPRYLVVKFKQYKNLGFSSYYEFLKTLFHAMMSKPNDGIYYRDKRIGRIVVTGPAPFINGDFKEANIPDEVFYVDGKTELLKTTEPKNVKPSDVSILNLFESRDWTEGNIDEFVLGAIFEKLMTAEDRKEKGAYYTPEPITEYISYNTIKPYLVDKINEKFGTSYESLDEFFEKDANEDRYVFLFNEMQNIKILDPACGSGHFLESAINVLVDIYEKIWEKAKKSGFSYEKFVILTADEKGEIVKEPLITISDENERILKLKFHIIISRNLYGVDILSSAIKVAKARMFMSLAKHFDAKRGTHVRFPNIQFNLRVGNSLLGFIDLSTFEKIEARTTLLDFLTTKDGESLDISLDKDIENYIKKMDKLMGTNAYALLAEVRDHFAQKLTQERLKKVLRLRSDLIKILLVSLDTNYATKLKELIEDITIRFNEKLNHEYIKYLISEGVKIKEDKLREIGYFHWIMEFSEVFFEKGGFDIVIGNPPYGFRKALSQFEKDLLRKIGFQFPSGDMAEVFTKRSISLTKNKGYFSFIIPKKSIYGESWSNLRRFLRNYFILSIADAGKAFEKVKLEMVIFVLKIIANRNFKIKAAYYSKEKRVVEEIGEFIDSGNDEEPFYIYAIGILKDIYEHIKCFPRLGDLDLLIKIGQGNVTSSMRTVKKYQRDVPILKGDDIGRYKIKNIHYLPYSKVDKEYLKPKLIFQEIIAHIQNPIPHIELMGVYDPNGIFTLHDTTVMYYSKNRFMLIFLLGLLNSKFASWFYYNFTYNRAIRTMHLIDYYAKQLPVPKEITKNSAVADLALYLSIITQILEQDNREFQRIFLDNLLDYIVYELYFKEKFYEDGFYSKPKEYLLESVSRYLRPIKYDRWAELYWKKLLKGELTKKEEKELKELEENNLATIKEVIEAIKADQNITRLIEKIKQHEWVKTIEGNPIHT